jgi:peptide deformylase
MKIVKYPHPALRVRAKPLAAIDADVQKAAGEMLELMYRSEGLGLAAPQVALDYQLIVMNFVGEHDRPDQQVVALNPVIVEHRGGTVSDREGCLSFPGLYQNVRRAKTVVVQYYDLQGNKMEMTCHDLAARVWQHEIDHLNGELFIDKFRADFEKDKKKGDLPPDLQPVD